MKRKGFNIILSEIVAVMGICQVKTKLLWDYCKIKFRLSQITEVITLSGYPPQLFFLFFSSFSRTRAFCAFPAVSVSGYLFIIRS